MNKIIKLVGTKRLIVLTVMVMVNLILAAFFFLWISPSSIEAERQLNALTSEISVLQTDIVTIKDQLEATRLNIPYFNRLGSIGFFNDQNRFRAERVIQQIQAQSGVKTASFEIGSLTDINDQRATDAEYRLVMSEIKVSGIHSYSDVEIYKLLYLLNNDFPGHTRIRSFNLAQSAEVTEGSLQQIRDPEKDIYYTDGEAVLEWYTMIKDKQEAVPELGGGVQ